MAVPATLLLLALLAAPGSKVTAPLPMAPVDVSGPYVIGIGDTIRIDVFNEPLLCQSVLVPNSGTINYPIVGEIKVAGLSTEEFSRQLQSTLAHDFLVHPQVTVKVETYGSKPVQVIGAVKNPGMLYLTGPTTVRQLLALAGGINSEKANREVHIIRKGTAEPLVINLEKLMAQADGDMPVDAGDIIYIPEGAVVYVSGQVVKPGTVMYTDGLNLTQALLSAGGTTPTARLRKAWLLRDGKRIQVRLSRILKGADTDIRLEPGDQIFIDQAVF